MSAFASVGAQRRPRTFASSAAAAGEGDSYSVLIYDYVPDILDKRGPYRAGHIEAAKKAVSSSSSSLEVCQTTGMIPHAISSSRSLDLSLSFFFFLARQRRTRW